MKIGKWVIMVAIIVGCVLFDIVLHLVTSVYSTMPDNPNYSIVAKMLGTEITVSLWALLSFSGAAYVYCRIRKAIPGEGVKKGLRYGSAIALLWLSAMLEGAALFGNPIINEFVVGLSDAIPVFLMGILLSLLKDEKGKNAAAEPFTPGQKMMAVLMFTGTFLIGRYVAYFTGAIQSGHQASPFYTFFWTLLMGACIGVVCILLGNNGNTLCLKRRAAKFGFLIFGVNWAAFLFFMPLLFSGYLIDVLSRIIIDTLLVTIGYYLTFSPRLSSLMHRISKFRIGDNGMTNSSSRIILFLLISLLLLVPSGCVNPGKPSDKTQESPPVTYPQEDPGVTSKQPVTDEADKYEADKYEVLESDRIPDWKKLKARVSISELTDHGSRPLNDEKRCGFSIHFPGSWTLDSSVLYNAENKKVAEIPPVVLLKTGQEAEFLDYKPVMEEELISHQVFNTKSCRGSKTITKIATESGSWYPHIYRLIDENYGFTMVLYSGGLNVEDETLYDRIVDTFSLE